MAVLETTTHNARTVRFTSLIVHSRHWLALEKRTMGTRKVLVKRERNMQRQSNTDKDPDTDRDCLTDRIIKERQTDALTDILAW